MSLAGKVAIVMGASKGIGKATALRLAKDGASVVINYSTDATSADGLVKSIGSDRALAVQADAGSIPDIDKIIKQTVDKFGKIDVGPSPLSYYHPSALTILQDLDCQCCHGTDRHGS